MVVKPNDKPLSKIAEGYKKKLAGYISVLKPKERLFFFEYTLDYNAKRATIAAGYSERTATAMATKLLNRTRIIKCLSVIADSDNENYQVERDEVLKHLIYCFTRTAYDFVDEKGRLIKDLSKLSVRAAASIDGIKQREHFDEDGNLIRVDTEYKLVSKGQALDMAMRHKALYSPEQHEHTVVVDFNQFREQIEEQDVIEKRIEAEYTVEIIPDKNNT
jgi:hypothetical protein